MTRTGLTYFAVKTKSAVKNTLAWLLQTALMGAMSAIYAFAIKDLSILSSLQTQYQLALKDGFEGTFHKWVCAGIRNSLAAKAATITVVGPTATVTIGNNPFSIAAEAITIPQRLLVKFWPMLCPNGCHFTVDGKQGIAQNHVGADVVLGVSRLNVLGLTHAEVSDLGDFMKLGDKFIVNEENSYVEWTDYIYAGDKLYTTDVAPNA